MRAVNTYFKIFEYRLKKKIIISFLCFFIPDEAGIIDPVYKAAKGSDLNANRRLLLCLLHGKYFAKFGAGIKTGRIAHIFTNCFH